MRFRTLEYGAALVLDLVGSAGALLIAARSWQHVVTTRPAPLGRDVLALSGRTVDSAPTALALVALAGVVAVIATRGWLRRVVGVVLAAAGAALVWRAVDAASAVSTARARALVTEHHRTVDAGAVVPRVEVSAGWPALTAVCGVLILLAGVLVAARGQRWRTLSSRYERPQRAAAPEPVVATKPTAPALWTAFDEGRDPTADNILDSAADTTPEPRENAPERHDTGTSGYPQS